MTKIEYSFWSASGQTFQTWLYSLTSRTGTTSGVSGCCLVR
jgi:hypothetical protein